MSTQDPKPKRQGRRGVPLHIYIPPALSDAITASAETERRKLTQEVIIALEEYLQRKGRWPVGEEPKTE